MENVFSDFALKYYESGYNVIPLKPSTKIPFITNWSQWCETKLATFQVEMWANTFSNCNIGIALGSVSNVIALDFDYNIDGIHTEIMDLLPSMPVRKVGARGFTAFFKYNGELPKKWYKDGKSVIELLSTGNQTVLPPSIHPDTKEPYKWLTLDTLLTISASELPTLPPNFIAKVDEKLGYKRHIKSYSSNNSHETINSKEVEKALTFIPSHEYAVWVTVGMALHHGLKDSGFDLWDAWSRKAPNYDASKMAGKWASFGKCTSPVTIATIFHYAISYGYHPVAHEEPLGFEITTDFIINTNISSSSTNTTDFPEYLLDAPGLPGEIATWINATSIKRQPILALGAAICASGTIFAHKIRNDSNLRTNFMVLGLAESGSGKNHARECIKSLFQACELSQYTFGKFASDAGLLNALSETNGIGLALIDEIGRELKVLNGRHAGGHELRLLTLMMEIYSDAGTVYDGKRYASAENCKQLVQPCLNIYGTSVPKRFYDSMSSDESIDGFLARWLIFPSNDIDPPLQMKGNLENPPERLIENIQYIKTMATYKEPTNAVVLLSPTPNPKIIQCTDGAKELLDELTVTCNDNRIKEIKNGGNLAPIWARTREHAIKLALVAHPYREGVIDINTMRWACNLALHLTNIANTAIKEHVTDSEYQRNMNRVFSVIQREGGEVVSARKLISSIRNIKAKEINEIIQHLQQSGRIEIIEKLYNGRISYSYKMT